MGALYRCVEIAHDAEVAEFFIHHDVNTDVVSVRTL